MKEIKSVRVRRRDVNYGTLDIKVTIFEEKNTFKADQRVVMGTNNDRPIWMGVYYPKKGLYKDYTDDQFIKDFIDMNSKSDGGGKTYDIIQDPWENKVPKWRSYGYDPYYLNNGAQIFISWTEGNFTAGGLTYSDDSGKEINASVSISKTVSNIIGIDEPSMLQYGKSQEIEYKSFDKPTQVYGGLVEDLSIIRDVISAWKRKVPNYDELALCSPDNQSCSIIPYKSPLKPPEPEVPPTEKVVVNEPPKEKMTVVLPPDVVKVKSDITSFVVYVGKVKEKALLENPSVEQDEFIYDDSEGLDEYTEEGFVGSDENAAQPFDLMQDSELLRDDNPSSPPPPDGGGSSTGGSQVNSPGGSVSKTEVALPTDLSKVRNSSIIKTQSMGGSSRGINNDIKSPKGDVVLGSDIAKSMNEFVLDVLGPFATFLKTKYPSLYSSWYITSATRGYVPPGGSLTSQHMKGEAIDSQILGANANNPGKNIELLNAILEWYKTNKVGYGQILFETRGNSCWIHWSYKRGNTRLQLLRFAQDSTLRSASVNTTGKYVLPPVTASQLGFSNYA